MCTDSSTELPKTTGASCLKRGRVRWLPTQLRHEGRVYNDVCSSLGPESQTVGIRELSCSSPLQPRVTWLAFGKEIMNLFGQRKALQSSVHQRKPPTSHRSGICCSRVVDGSLWFAGILTNVSLVSLSRNQMVGISLLKARCPQATVCPVPRIFFFHVHLMRPRDSLRRLA